MESREVLEEMIKYDKLIIWWCGI